MSNVVVVGAGGMTGSELMMRASDHGLDVRGFTRAELDVGDADSVARAIEAESPRVVINAAAYTAVDKAEIERDVAMRVNADGAGNVARAAAAIGASVVHISTDYVFDGTSKTPYMPNDAVHPLGVYGESKLAGENAVRSEAEAYAIVRTSWIFSHRGRNFVRTMLDRGRSGDPLRVVNDQHGNPTAASDLADALLRVAAVMSDDATLRGTWHFTNAGSTTWFEFACAIFDCAGIHAAVEPISTSRFPTAAVRPAYSILDTSSFTTTFGVTPRHWSEPLRETLEQLN